MEQISGFSLDDLAFNQEGDLSPAQKHRLVFEFAFWIGLIGLDLGLIIIAWLVYYLQYNLQIFLVGGLFWSFVLGMAGLSCIRNARPLWADLKGNQVESISGVVSKHYGFGKEWIPGHGGEMMGVNWSVEIRGQIFSVAKSVYATIVEHQTYRLFYTPNTKKIMNIEPLPLLHAEKQAALAALQKRASSIVKDAND